jgi:hypothetical protein
VPQENPFDSLTPAQRAYAEKFVGANPDATVDQVFAAIREVSPQGSTVLDKVRGVLSGARKEVGGVLSSIDTLGGRLPGGMGQGFITPDTINPVPATPGDAAALLASGVAGGATRGLAGSVPAVAARIAAPVAAGAATDYFDNQDVTTNAVWRTLATGGAEAVAGAYGLLKRIRGAKALEQPDLNRVARGVNQATDNVRPVKPTPEDIALAGESSPKAGNPKASSSLEAAIKGRYRQALDEATGIVGNEKVKFPRVTGGQGTLREALDDYASLAEGRMEGIPGDQKAMAEKLWSAIRTQLYDRGFPHVIPLLDNARTTLAKDMSAYRAIQDARKGATIGDVTLPPLVDSKTGKFDMSKFQQRINALADAGMIDPSVRDILDRQIAQRGGRQPGQPLTDQPGEFKIGSWLRFGHGGVPSVGMHPESFAKVQFPKHIGPDRALSGEQPVQGLPRVLLSIGSLLGMQKLKELTGGNDE